MKWSMYLLCFSNLQNFHTWIQTKIVTYSKILVNLEFWEFGMSFKKYLLPNGWVRMFNINLKMSLLVILWPSSWSCWCCRSLMLRNENPDTLASHSCTKNHPIVVIGVAFSLIVIILKMKSFVRVHSLVVSNILIEKIQNCEHIIILY